MFVTDCRLRAHNKTPHNLLSKTIYGERYLILPLPNFISYKWFRRVHCEPLTGIFNGIARVNDGGDRQALHECNGPADWRCTTIRCTPGSLGKLFRNACRPTAIYMAVQFTMWFPSTRLRTTTLKRTRVIENETGSGNDWMIGLLPVIGSSPSPLTVEIKSNMPDTRRISLEY
jgi:hypothetical protein